MKSINTLCGENAEFVKAKVNGKYITILLQNINKEKTRDI
jgi:hypothetical protein